jgi:hypothetical protein
MVCLLPSITVLLVTQVGPITTAAVLQRVRDYVAAYELRLSALAAEERYVQRVVGSRAEVRVIESDYLFVRPPDEAEAWLGFRDAYRVDGKDVADRTDRLRRLLEEWSGDARAQAMAIAFESARHNLGGFIRTVNVPVGVLGWLHPRLRDHFSFARGGTELFERTTAWRLRFRETGRPTRIRTPQGRDVVASGMVWVDPVNGHVLQTELRTESGRIKATIRVRFAREARLDLMVPVEMRERYTEGSRTIEAEATYTNFRVFTVTSRVK